MSAAQALELRGSIATLRQLSRGSLCQNDLEAAAPVDVHRAPCTCWQPRARASSLLSTSPRASVGRSRRPSQGSSFARAPSAGTTPAAIPCCGGAAEGRGCVQPCADRWRAMLPCSRNRRGWQACSRSLSRGHIEAQTTEARRLLLSLSLPTPSQSPGPLRAPCCLARALPTRALATRA